MYRVVGHLPSLMYVLVSSPMVELHDRPVFAKSSNYQQYHVPVHGLKLHLIRTWLDPIFANGSGRMQTYVLEMECS